MLEFITMKDPHFSFGFMNKIRTSYEKHILQKLDFVKGYCLENNVGSMVFTGDVFDSSAEDKWSFKKYRKNKRVLEQFPKSNINLFSNVGNHDMFHGYEGSDDTIFGEMVHDEILNDITQVPILASDEAEKTLIKVQGINYSNEDNIILDNIRAFDDEVYPGISTFKVAVLHSNVTPDVVTHVTDFTYKSLADQFTDIGMFILGHYHVGYPTTTYTRDDGSEVIFVNNWNFTRVVRDYEVQLDEHAPEFEHITIRFDKIQSKFICETKTIQVPFVPFKNAFVKMHVDILSKNPKDIFSFFKNISFNDVRKDSLSTDDEMLNTIVSKNNYSDEAKISAVEYLNNAKT